MTKMACLWFALCIVVGGFLFQTTQRVNDGRQRLAALTQSIQTEEESLRVLQAEWSYLNQPDRLEKLSREYLRLSPMKGRQFARTDSIPLRPQPEQPATESDVLLTAAALEAAESAPHMPRVPVRKPPRRAAVMHHAPAAPEKTPEIPSAKVVHTAAPARTAGAAEKTDAPRKFSDVINALGVTGR